MKQRYSGLRLHGHPQAVGVDVNGVSSHPVFAQVESTVPTILQMNSYDISLQVFHYCTSQQHQLKRVSFFFLLPPDLDVHWWCTSHRLAGCETSQEWSSRQSTFVLSKLEVEGGGKMQSMFGYGKFKSMARHSDLESSCLDASCTVCTLKKNVQKIKYLCQLRESTCNVRGIKSQTYQIRISCHN